MNECAFQAQRAAREESTLPALDAACLRICIALLDHDLRVELFESAVVGFFAVLAIDVDKDNLRDACAYTPLLSGFIKIAQMLVIQRAIDAADAGEVEHPADLIGEMRDRFMIHGTRSPFNWASRLRIYGKKARDSATSLGFIAWADDGASLAYRDIADFRIADFRRFVAE